MLCWSGIYCPRKIKAEPDLSFAWDKFSVRYKCYQIKVGLASRHGGVKCSLISARTKTLLNYVTKRRNRSSDSSADGRVESPEAKKAKNADNLEILAANREHAGDASEEDSDIVLTALELTDDLSGILKGILEKLNKLDTIERAVKKIEGSLVKLEERTTKLEALDCK